MSTKAHICKYKISDPKRVTRSTLSNLTVLLIALIIDAFLLINGGLIFGQSWQPLSGELREYIMLEALILFLAVRTKNPFSEITIWRSMVYFVPSLLAFWVVFQAANILKGVIFSPLPVNDIIMNITFQIFVVSFSEELFFRGILLKYIGVVPQGILFGLFHLTAYNGIHGINYDSIFFACVFGIIYGVIVKYFQSKNKAGVGISITWGLHAGYNLAFLVGILTI